MKVRLRFRVSQDVEYEIECSPEEIWGLKSEIVEKLGEVARELASVLFPKSEPNTEDMLEGLVEVVNGRPHLGTKIRSLNLKDQILYAVVAMSRTGKSSVRPIEVFEFMRNDGFPVNHKSVKNRMAELVRDGLLIKNGDGEYSLSRFGEERLIEIARGVKVER